MTTLENNFRRLTPLRKDGMWRQERHVPNVLNEDGSLDYEPFAIKKEQGAWFVSRGDGAGDAAWVPVREDFARVIVLGIEAERRMKERKGKWELDSSQPDVDDDGNDIFVYSGEDYLQRLKTLAVPKTYTEFYCHAVLQYLLKLPRGNHEADAIYRSIEGFAFASPNSYDDVVAQFQGMEFPVIGRIVIPEVQTHEDLGIISDIHSFIILGRDARGEYLCFEKADSYENPVRLNTLAHIYEHHQECSFAFQSFDTVAEQVQRRGLAQAA